jgi:phosphatidylserine/phosphatidylglycerophosphate/cardiolipin synthase-like enzyme
MSSKFQVSGRNFSAPFTLKVHRGDGMALLAMNWKAGTPPDDFVGFAIQYKEPGGDKFFGLKNLLNFLDSKGRVSMKRTSTMLAPIQMFRWIHFPRNPNLAGDFVYRVTPVFMNDDDELSYGESQEAAIELRRETYPGRLNVTFTRGFVSSQAFVTRYESKGPVSKLLPAKADLGLRFTPTHPDTQDALAWMGFETREAILDVLDRAIADEQARVCVVAYDLNEPDIVSRLERLGDRLKVIIDDSDAHGKQHSSEAEAARRLAASAGAGRVKRHHMGGLQHNKTIIVDGPKGRTVVCGSTNFSWRGLFVQANNAVILRGKKPVKAFQTAFDAYWDNDDPGGFGGTASAGWADLGMRGIRARVAFSPHSAENALLAVIADDIRKNTTSSLFYSLAFLYQTKGPMRDAVEEVSRNEKLFVYGISDRKVSGLDLQDPNGNIEPVFAASLTKNAPEPFKAEPKGGGGNRMHHKFVVVDFDKPTARVYLGSYNFSPPADTDNGENLVLIRNRRIAVSYAVEALRIFDHYHFRVTEKEKKRKGRKFSLVRPPRRPGQKTWWARYYSDPRKIRERAVRSCRRRDAREFARFQSRPAGALNPGPACSQSLGGGRGSVGFPRNSRERERVVELRSPPLANGLMLLQGLDRSPLQGAPCGVPFQGAQTRRSATKRDPWQGRDHPPSMRALIMNACPPVN